MLCIGLDTGCGTWLGNPKDPGKEKPAGNSSVTLSVQGSLPTPFNLTASADLPVIGKGGNVIGTLTLTEARLSLKEIKLKLASDDAVGRQEFQGPFVVDLLTSQLKPDPGTIEVPAGTYRDIELNLATLDKDAAGDVVAAGDPLIDRSIFLTGTYKPAGGVSSTVVMDFDVNERFSLGRAGSAFAGMNVVEGQPNSVIIAFGVGQWFNFSGKDADFSDLAGASIVLTKEAKGNLAQDVRKDIKENIKGSAKFGKDDDHDGKLGEHERNED